MKPHLKRRGRSASEPTPHWKSVTPRDPLGALLCHGSMAPEVDGWITRIRLKFAQKFAKSSETKPTIFHYHIEYELLLWSTSKITLIIHDYPISASMRLISWKISIPPSPWDVEDGCDPMRSKGHGRTWNKSPEIVYLGTESAQLWLGNGKKPCW